MKADVLIAGGGPAAIECAEAYRRHGGSGRVVMVGQEPRTPYERPALSRELVAGASLAGDEEAAWSQAPGLWTMIGERTLKYVGWGDGFDSVSLTDHQGQSFTARQFSGDELVGALCHEADEDYEHTRAVLEGRSS